MTGPSENLETGPADDLMKIVSELNPTDIEIDSLGRIVVKSKGVRDALRKAAAHARAELVAASAPTNAAQCACHNISSCHKIAED